MAKKGDKRKNSLGYKANKQYLKNIRGNFLSILYAILMFAFVAAVILLEIMPSTYDVTVGESATETILAITEVENTEETEAARKLARESVADVYSIDTSITDSTTLFFEKTVFEGLEKASEFGYDIRNGITPNDGFEITYDAGKIKYYGEHELSFLKNSETDKYDEAKIKNVLNSNPSDVLALKEWFCPELKATLKAGIRADELSSATATLITKVELTDVTDNTMLKSILVDLIEENVTANERVDERATEKTKNDAEASVATVYYEINTPVVVKDEIVTQSQYDALLKMGMLEEGGIPFRLLAGTIAISFLLTVAIVFYMLLFEKKLSLKPKRVLLLCLLSITDIIISLIFKSANWEMMMNTAMAVVLIAVFFNEHFALVMNVALSVVLALIVSVENDLFGIDSVAMLISNIAGGTAAVYVCKNVRVASRARMFLPGTVAGIISTVTSFLVLVISGKSFEASVSVALYGIAGGVVASLYTAGSLSVWEVMFNLLTQSKLLELSNSGSDLLRKMSIEIPGTYQHSSTVAEMAENAAKDIGANAMLARAASLYHDIGKIRVPECYTENQTEDSRSFHSSLSPYESAQMIISHVTEGAKLAKANKLPQEIIDIILQHHGTSPVLYFYNKARATDENTSLEDYSYPGPETQTKEAGIIMLADCVEASIRSMDIKDAEAIKAQIEKMFKARMEAGELDECELSLKDINTLKKSFATTLIAVYHTRIKYDNAVTAERK